MTDNPFTADAKPNNTISAIVDQIDKVVKSPTIKKGETGAYHFFINGEEITIPTSQLTQGPGRFRTLYFDTFGKLPYIDKDKEWPVFIEYIAQIAEIGEYEESAALMAADLLFEGMVSEFQVTQDKEKLLAREGCNYFVEHNPHGEAFYVVPSAAITSMLSEIKIKVSVEDVSQAMTARGYKRGNTQTVKVTGSPVRCWWFNESAIKAAMPEIEVML